MFDIPPPQYDYPYKGQLVINYILSQEEINRRCYSVSMATVGCAFLGEGHCTILIWRGVTEKRMEVLIRHEVAHCNGWPKDHPR